MTGCTPSLNFSIYYPSLVERMVVVSAPPCQCTKVLGSPDAGVCLCEGVYVCVSTSMSVRLVTSPWGLGHSGKLGFLPHGVLNLYLMMVHLGVIHIFVSTYRLQLLSPLKIYCLFILAVMGLCFCTWAFSCFSEQGLLFVVVHRLPIVAFLVAEHGSMWASVVVT